MSCHRVAYWNCFVIDLCAELEQYLEKGKGAFECEVDCEVGLELLLLSHFSPFHFLAMLK